MSHAEDWIRRLCSDLLAAQCDEDFGPLIIELRDALHQHVEAVREHIGIYRLLAGGRARPENPIQNNDDGTAEESGRQSRVLKRRIA